MAYLPIWPLLLAVTGANGDPPCEARSAAPVTIAELAAEPRRYKGRCVAVTAPATHWSLFSSTPSLERQVRSSRSALVRRSERRRQVGWYHPPGELDPQVELGLAKGILLSVRGIVDDCHTLRERELSEAKAEYRRELAARPREPAPPPSDEDRLVEEGEPSAVFLFGYCHWNPGTIIRAVAVTPATGR
jgi:hypothetical protein